MQRRSGGVTASAPDPRTQFSIFIFPRPRTAGEGPNDDASWLVPLLPALGALVNGLRAVASPLTPKNRP